MELHQIRYFLAACETLNFTRAAEIRNVSQPALTKAIHMLEDELGGSLFDTQSRPIQLTAFGELLRQRFELVDDMLVDIKSASSKFHRMEDSTFTIGVLNTIGDNDFIDVIKKVQAKLLGVAIIVTHSSQEYLTQQLKAGRLELAVVTGYPLKASLLEGETLYTEPYVLCVPPSHRFADRNSVTLEDLDGEDYVRRDHCEKNVPLMAALDELDVSVKIHLSTDQDAFARKMIGAGLGVSIMPRAQVKEPLRAIELKGPDMTREIRLVHRKARLLSPIATKVMNAIIGRKHSPESSNE